VELNSNCWCNGSNRAGDAKLLAERNFPLQDLFVVADPREAGKTVSFNDKDLIVQAASPEIFAQADAALFAVDSSISKILAPMAIENKCLVIDNSNAFRMDEKVPLVVPEVNAEDIKLHQGLIANPNCSTIIMVVAINPIHKAVGIERVVVSTYQAVSGAGAAGIDELSAGVAAYQDQVKLEPKVFQHPIAFNVIPHIDVFEANDYTREEMKMVFETRKIMHAEDIRIAATAVRVPVYRSHSEAISIETKTHITPEQVRDILKQAPGVIVQISLVRIITRCLYMLPIRMKYMLAESEKIFPPIRGSCYGWLQTRSEKALQPMPFRSLNML
jgi:aspartate-semialdehyde dehydrogenase